VSLRRVWTGPMHGWSDSRWLESSDKTRMPLQWSPSLALPRCPRRTPTQSRRRLRSYLPEGPRVCLPFTSRGPRRASTPPTLLHRSKRRLHQHKWVCSRSLLPLPRHTVWWVLFQWTRAKMLMVSRTVRQKNSGMRIGHDQSHQRRWTLMDEYPPVIPRSRLWSTPLHFFLLRGQVIVQHLSVRDSYGLYTSHSCFLPLFPSHRCVHAVLRPAEFPMSYIYVACFVCLIYLCIYLDSCLAPSLLSDLLFTLLHSLTLFPLSLVSFHTRVYPVVSGRTIFRYRQLFDTLGY